MAEKRSRTVEVTQPYWVAKDETEFETEEKCKHYENCKFISGDMNFADCWIVNHAIAHTNCTDLWFMNFQGSEMSNIYSVKMDSSYTRKAIRELVYSSEPDAFEEALAEAYCNQSVVIVERWDDDWLYWGTQQEIMTAFYEEIVRMFFGKED